MITLICLQSDIQMFSDRLRNLFKRTAEPNDDQSIFDKAANIINSSRRTITENPLADFDCYLSNMPWEQLKVIMNRKPKPKKTATLRPELTAKCYKNVPKIYFDPHYLMNEDSFIRSRQQMTQDTMVMHQYLDQVELCLFNQISSRFDQILAVLRTIESLECIVDFNAERLRQVRGNSIKVAKKAALQNVKIVALLKKQEKLKKTLATLAEMKLYTGFIKEDPEELEGSHLHSQKYEQINQIRLRRQLFFQLQSTKNFEERVQQLQSNLKKSYSDSINDSLFKYAVQIVPYDPKFWQRKFLGRIIFQQDQNQQQGTVILDESVLIEQDTGGLTIKTNEQRQKQIVNNVVSGWRDGQYATGAIKAAFDKFIKERHYVFLSDCRNFCFEAYLKEDRQKLENPNLANLIEKTNTFFCSKVFLYYGDMYRTLLMRCYSLISRTVNEVLGVCRTEQFNIEEKDKVSRMIDGLLSILTFIIKATYDKILEIFELKEIYESMELQDFKQLINVLQTEQDFINKHLRKFVEQINAQKTFLDDTIVALLDKFDFEVVTRFKQQKVRFFLNRNHNYIIQNQLRESFQNEVWKPTDIPTFYYDSLHYLITGQSLNLRRNKNHSIRHNISTNFESSVFIDRMGQASILFENKSISKFRIIRNEIIIEGKVYKVVGTLLLLLELIEDYLHLVQFYPFVREEAGIKVFQLIRTYNTTSHQLIFLAGAVKLQKIKTKTITARHLALNSLCLAFLVYIMECIRDRVPISKQEQIRHDLREHQHNIIKRLGSILTSKYSQGINDITLGSIPSKGTQFIVNNTKNLHDILVDYYQKDVLRQIFIKANVEVYLKKLKSIPVSSKIEAQSLKDDMNFYFHEVKFLEELIDDFNSLRIRAEEIVREKFQQL